MVMVMSISSSFPHSSRINRRLNIKALALEGKSFAEPSEHLVMNHTCFLLSCVSLW